MFGYSREEARGASSPRSSFPRSSATSTAARVARDPNARAIADHRAAPRARGHARRRDAVSDRAVGFAHRLARGDPLTPPGSATSPSGGRPRRRCGSARRSCGRRRRWKRSGGSPAASRTISTTCSPPSSATRISSSTASTPAIQRRADIEEIKRAAHRAAGLTRQLLAFSRKQVMQPQRINLNEIIREPRNAAPEADRPGDRASPRHDPVALGRQGGSRARSNRS